MDKYSCDVIKDLLPSYIDGLTSEASNEIIRAHLETCPDCKKTYNSMNDGESPSTTPAASSASKNPSAEKPIRIDDAAVMRKINQKMKKRSLRNVVIGVVVGAILLTALLFVFPPKRSLSANEYRVTYMNLDMHELIGSGIDKTFTFDEASANEKSVMIYDNRKTAVDCSFVELNISGYDATIYVDKEYLEENPEICVISIVSTYYIASYDEDVVTKDGMNKLRIKSVKTPLFGGRSDENGYYRVIAVEFTNVDGIA